MKTKRSFMRGLTLAVVFAAAAAAQQVPVNPPTLPNGVVGIPYQQNVFTGINAAFNWTISQGALPPGLTLTNFSPSTNTGQEGRIAGTPTTVGTFTFTVQGTAGITAPQTGTRQYTIIITAPTTAPLVVTPNALTFDGLAFGEPTGRQFVIVTATGTTPLGFNVTPDNGSGGAPPDWLVPFPLANGTTPGRITVFCNPGALAAGVYTARIRILATGANVPIDVPVTCRVTNAASKLEVFPRDLRFAALVDAPKRLEQALLLRNSGGGGIPISFRAAVLNGSTWLSVTPATGALTSGTQLLRAVANTVGLGVGGYRDTIRISSITGDLDVTVVLIITASGAILQVADTGFLFTIKQNNSIPFTNGLRVSNAGTSGTMVNWTVTEMVPPGVPDSINVTTARGSSTVGTPSSIMLAPNATADALPVGPYYTLLTVTDPNALNSPQYILVVLEVAEATRAAEPVLSAGTLTFTAVANSTAVVPTQNLFLFVSNLASLVYQASANTFDTRRWLSIGAPQGTVNTRAPAVIVASVNTSGLNAGVYFGEIVVLLAGQPRVVTVLLILLPPGATLGAEVESGAELDSGAAEKTRAVTGCTPSRVVIAPGMLGSFSFPAGWPAGLSARLLDDCGTLQPGGSVVVRFDNGDSPLTLLDGGATGVYQGTWTPAFPSANVTATFAGTAGTFPTTTYQVGGGVNNNAFAPPQLFDGGTVNNTNPLGGALLAPGTVTAAYGLNLATSTVSPGVIPLVNAFNGTSLIMGGIASPLYFLSGGQLNVQAPVELPVNQQVAVAAAVNNAFAVLPKPVVMVAAAPGISSFADTKIIAQHADFTLVDAASPSKAGESIVTYVSGMGSTTPSVASGIQTPNQLTPAKILPTVTVNGVAATILYAGLTPLGIGLYQINFTVPPGTTPGDATVVITQNGVIANVTKLPVGAP